MKQASISPCNACHFCGEWVKAGVLFCDTFCREDYEAQEAARAYGVGGYPFMAFVGANGKITARTSGEVPVEQLQIYANAAVAAK
jgi:hypothetical protein